MKTITETQLRILEKLNDYRFLTVPQMLSLGIANHSQTLNKALKMMYDAGKPLLDYINFGTFPTIGRIPYVYYLTKHGSALLAEALQLDPEELTYPKGVKMFARDYFHRLQVVNFHILARSFCELYGASMDFFQTYFEHQGANHWGDPDKPKREALNKIPITEKTALIPDIIFQITDPKGKQWLFTGEVYQGHDTKRAYKQLEKHLLAIQKGSINTVYEYSRGIPVLVICEGGKAKNALMKRVSEDPAFSKAENFFLFRTLKNFLLIGDKKQQKQILKEEFAMGWETYSAKERGLFR